MPKTSIDIKQFKLKALKWASGFDAVCYLDTNSISDDYGRFDCLIAVGVKDEISPADGNAFEQLKAFRQKHQGYITGFFGYDLKNEIEQLTSANPDYLGFPDLYFFAPLHLIIVKNGEVELQSDENILDEINRQSISKSQPAVDLKLQSRFNKQEYLDAVTEIKAHIVRGDIYVTNFCQEFFAENTAIDPVDIFFRLNELSPNPLSSFFKWKDNYVLGASPERFLAKRGDQLISQPIKGTARRGITATEDEAIKRELRNNTKEQQENVMVVDMVRNDLTRSAKQGSVKTEKLFDIQSFRQVHQMVSTVVCQLDDEINAIDAIKNTFPMGSMTGAPKVSAMQLMEQYERSKRGVYSGAIGYFDPNDDFDFNVVIRSLLYNATDNYLSFHTGSAITYHADPEKEYEECLLKAKAIMEVLGQS